MSIIFYADQNKLRLFIHYLYIQANTWLFGWSYTPGTIHMRHCSSGHYSIKNLFITTLSLKTPALFKIFYYTYQHQFLLLSKVVPMKVRLWRPMSNAKYIMIFHWNRWDLINIKKHMGSLWIFYFLEVALAYAWRWQRPFLLSQKHWGWNKDQWAKVNEIWPWHVPNLGGLGF